MATIVVRPEGPPGQIIGRFLRGGAFDIVMSQPIIDEVLRALNSPKVRKYTRPGLDPELWFEDLVVLAHLVAADPGFDSVCKHSDDDEYIAAAIEGRAGFVVAGGSDLPDLIEGRRHPCRQPSSIPGSSRRVVPHMSIKLAEK